MLEPLTAIKATTIFEKGGWEVSGVILARGAERCLVEAGAVRWMSAPDLAAVMHPARAGTLGTLVAAPAEDPPDEEEEAWRAEMAALCQCEGTICGGVLARGICDSALD